MRGRGPSLPRLFISHSSKDSIDALAFQRWLELKGWSRDDVFIDLHDMQAGEKWRETLVKANVACDALLFLASPGALDSDECKREVRRAEDCPGQLQNALARSGGVTGTAKGLSRSWVLRLCRPTARSDTSSSPSLFCRSCALAPSPRDRAQRAYF